MHRSVRAFQELFFLCLSIPRDIYLSSNAIRFGRATWTTGTEPRIYLMEELDFHCSCRRRMGRTFFPAGRWRMWFQDRVREWCTVTNASDTIKLYKLLEYLVKLCLYICVFVYIDFRRETMKTNLNSYQRWVITFCLARVTDTSVTIDVSMHMCLYIYLIHDGLASRTDKLGSLNYYKNTCTIYQANVDKHRHNSETSIFIIPKIFHESCFFTVVIILTLLGRTWFLSSFHKAAAIVRWLIRWFFQRMVFGYW